MLPAKREDGFILHDTWAGRQLWRARVLHARMCCCSVESNITPVRSVVWTPHVVCGVLRDGTDSVIVSRAAGHPVAEARRAGRRSLSADRTSNAAGMHEPYLHQQHGPRALRPATAPVPGGTCGANPLAAESAAVIVLPFFITRPGRLCPGPVFPFFCVGAR